MDNYPPGYIPPREWSDELIDQMLDYYEITSSDWEEMSSQERNSMLEDYAESVAEDDVDRAVDAARDMEDEFE